MNNAAEKIDSGVVNQPKTLSEVICVIVMLI